MSALPNRQRDAALGTVYRPMQDFLQHIDLDYYRSALLLVARADVKRLREERSICADLERRSKIPLGTCPSAASAAVQVSAKTAR